MGWLHDAREERAHPSFRADPRKSLAYALADILLTRGEGKIDEIPFASEIEWGVPGPGMEGYLIGKLGHLASTESSAVKAAACVQLWIYQQDRLTAVFASRLGTPSKPRNAYAA
jgi:hypothetical protein